MPGNVRYTDGIRFDLDGVDVALDARTPSAAANVLSHAHGDHLFGGDPPPLVCSPVTAALAGARRDVAVETTTHPAVELLPAGHVAGSRAALVTDPATGRRYCYTGDVCTRDRFYLSGFEPPDADVLVLEATYGKPAFVFPDHDAVAAEILDWLADTADRPVLLCGYSLGRAQKLQALFAESDRRGTCYVTGAVAEVNDVLNAHEGFPGTFDAERYGSDVDLAPGDALVLPSAAATGSFAESIVAETGAPKAGFSGWAVGDAFRYRGDYDVTFPLSDHCDYRELLALVEAVDPDRAYTHHGFDDALAGHLRRELGVPAQSLKRNQTTLGEF